MRLVDEGFLKSVRGKGNRDRFLQAKTNARLIKQIKNGTWNHYKVVDSLKVIEASSIVSSMNSWRLAKGSNSTVAYNVADIVLVDLGLGYGFEMSYQHPCVILYESQGFCYVVPCSTGKYGKRNKFIMDAKRSDGFEDNTGILLDAVRCISKTRIISLVGQVNIDCLNKINEALFKLYLSKKHNELKVAQKDIVELQQEKIALIHEIEKLKEEIKEKSKELAQKR
ncbi:type II toxin-antitoxin system PemK/MazF family toxin [Lysinibacillus capsici]|uniref:type II toxin-antitoxin system PemK/MazF family toxin n=1 Tax=Lysinibacillus capsici TaxID=2115968 RepID=UPI0024802633|nr:type II toxin-antitoxin system PemK/MazF family toxin [Lysinibacillus capsici]